MKLFWISVLHEVKWVCGIVNERKDYESHTKAWKRCKVLQTTIAILKNHFVDDDSKENDVSDLLKGNN